MHNKVVEPKPQQITTIDFEEAFEYKMIWQTLQPCGPRAKGQVVHSHLQRIQGQEQQRCLAQGQALHHTPRRCCIKSKWVFKIKHDGVFHAQLVASGYNQIPGVDFTEKLVQVMNDVMWCILLVAMLIWKMDAMIINVETAFMEI